MLNSQGDLEIESPENFAQRMNLHFNDFGLLARALTHRSYLNEHREVLEDNERLEFLGDAVLDFLVGAWMYNHFPEMAEGQLTRMRAALVGNEQLAEFARKVGMGRAMRLGHGEDESGGRERSALLGSTFEAVVGALFLDQGVEAVQRFVEPMLEIATEQILVARREQDPKSMLQEWSQANNLGTPVYRLVSDTGPDHDKHFEIEVVIGNEVRGCGSGQSKQVAAKEAARSALKNLGLE